MTPSARPLAAALLAAAIGLAASGVQAQDPRWEALRQDQRIDNGLMIVAIGDYLVDGCPDIGVRRSVSTPFMWGLARHALSLGYSPAEIEEFVNDDAEEARVRARARQWLAQEGASVDDPESLCRVAREQIAAETVIGGGLRER